MTLEKRRKPHLIQSRSYYAKCHTRSHVIKNL